MDNQKWIKILDEKKKLDPERIITPVDESLPAYLVEGINQETSADEFLMVYDCSAFAEENTFGYEKILELSIQHNDPYPVVVFKNWEHERKIYWSFYKKIPTANKRKEFTAWFDGSSRFMWMGTTKWFWKPMIAASTILSILSLRRMILLYMDECTIFRSLN